MSRQLIVGRFGADDKIEIPTAADEQATRLELVAGDRSLDHGIGGALTTLKTMNVFPSEVGIDLLVIAAHVYAADTRISRSQQSQDSWTREIRLVVPVSDPVLWQSAAATLVRALNFLTGDKWKVDFRVRPQRFTTIANLPDTLLPPVFNELSLFSGGLDSLAGVIDLLESGRTPLLVSHASEGATSSAQNELFTKLKARYSEIPFERLRVWMSFPNGLVSNVDAEPSTRGRSFLFFAIGVFAGTGLGTEFKLRVPENGLIALNVPLDPLRLGSNSTRTTHPFYIARWNDLINELGINGSIENPYWNKTKGEMVIECANQELIKELASESLSCSSPAKARWSGYSNQHCGYCLPCLIRRAALDSAWGANVDNTSYTISNLRESPLNTLDSTGKQVRSFQYAIERLRKNPAIASLLIHKPGPLTDVIDEVEQLANVYSRGLAEVAQLINGVVTKPSR